MATVRAAPERPLDRMGPWAKLPAGRPARIEDNRLAALEEAASELKG